MSIEVDFQGNPIDPKIRALEFRLIELNAAWSLAFGNDEKRAEIVNEYHKVVSQLYEMGWNREIDYENQLPEELMPEEYKKRNPPII